MWGSLVSSHTVAFATIWRRSQLFKYSDVFIYVPRRVRPLLYIINPKVLIAYIFFIDFDIGCLYLSLGSYGLFLVL